ncbi:hypothetical protein [Mycobacterium noviomagense]|uniref:Transmembrane protein n=1 Tax=Mycobacterium noviomagense TaxID=459858 RepID=A0A7I7PKH5_9MYCO|nr:hypothetical protein [Mycobacterium noviomagense]ORB12257.1 hypothetical protein BST37_16705 [Mycobacterium noviomagense]BBY09055.1 hypothetical protein MNVI_43730 [Mycobacterium noviomagense]
MLIIALVLAVIGLAALVFAVVTSNELVAWVCIGASVVGVVLLIIDALQERQRRQAGGGEPVPAGAEVRPGAGQTGYGVSGGPDSATQESDYADYPEDLPEEHEEHPAAESGTATGEKPAPDADHGDAIKDDNTR